MPKVDESKKSAIIEGVGDSNSSSNGQNELTIMIWFQKSGDFLSALTCNAKMKYLSTSLWMTTWCCQHTISTMNAGKSDLHDKVTYHANLKEKLNLDSLFTTINSFVRALDHKRRKEMKDPHDILGNWYQQISYKLMMLIHMPPKTTPRISFIWVRWSYQHFHQGYAWCML